MRKYNCEGSNQYLWRWYFSSEYFQLADIVGKHVSIRVFGGDAPELGGKSQFEKIVARKARQHTVELLGSGKIIELKKIKRGKYFRILTDVYIDSKSLAESLISNHLARPYDGGKG